MREDVANTEMYAFKNALWEEAMSSEIIGKNSDWSKRCSDQVGYRNTVLLLLLILMIVMCTKSA